MNIIKKIVLMPFVAFNQNLAIKYYTVKTQKITEPLCIVHLSDLHNVRYGPHQSVLIEAIDEQKPDLVCLTGDMADELMPHKSSEELLLDVSHKYPTYFVSGNHEMRMLKVDELKTKFKGYGIHVLEGQHTIFKKNEQTLYISGIDDPLKIQNYREQLKASAEGLTKENFNLLLVHRPEFIKDYQRYPFDLILCGHTHGGQWRVPGYINGVYCSNQGLFPEYGGGRYDFPKNSMIINRGLAKNHRLVPRIFNRPELVVIHLEPENRK